MDLNELPRKYEWSYRGNLLLVKKIAWLPVARFSDSGIGFFLDVRLHKQILCLLKFFKETKSKICFLTPEMANPRLSIDNDEIHSKIIENYLINYSKPEFFDGFKKIDFDIIENLIEYCNTENCQDLIKDIYLSVNYEVQRIYYDYYTNQRLYVTEREDIRDSFNSLYREIQIYRLLK